MNQSEPNVVLLDQGSLSIDERCFQKLYEHFPNCKVYHNTNKSEVLQRTRDADIIITNKVILSSEVIEKALQLKMISLLATGYNNVDITATKEKQVIVSNVRSYGTPSIVQHVFMLILNLATRFPEYNQAVREGRWNKSEQFCLLDYNITELSGKTLGIIGYGELGKAVKHIAKAFGMQVHVAARKGQVPSEDRYSFHDVIANSDIITLHCPLNNQTKNLIDKSEFVQMKPTAFLINAARGGVVNESALKEALIEGQIAGAGVDVLTEEPPVKGNILLDHSIPNLLITPHTAWASMKSQQRAFDMAIENIVSFLEGKPINVIS